MYEKIAKNGFTRNAIISKPKKVFCTNFITTNLKLVNCVQISSVSRLNWLRNNPSNSVMARSGRFGSGRFITDNDYMVKKSLFLFNKPY